MGGHIYHNSQTITNMNKQLRNVLAAAVVAISPFMATAQSETFTGASGNVYYADYEAGLVMQVTDEENHYVYLVSPDEVVDNELRPYLDRLYTLAANHDMNYEILQMGCGIAQRAIDLCVSRGDGYEEYIEVFITAANRYIAGYDKLLQDLESLLAQRKARKATNSRNGLMNRLAKAPYTTEFAFEIDSAISELAYTANRVEWAGEYIDWFVEEALDLEKKVDEESIEIENIIDFYSELLDRHLTHLENIQKWLEANEDEGITEEELEELISDIEDQRIDIEVELEYIPENPMLNVKPWLDNCNESMAKAYELYVEAEQIIYAQAEKWGTIINNFSGVIFAGAYGEKFGMYESIIANEGKLILPDYVEIEAADYRIVGAKGNIFSCVYEDVDMTGTQLVMPSTIRQIHNEAFAMDGIVAVYVPTPEVPTMDADCFTASVYDNAILYVEDNWVASYKARDPWKKFYDIKGLSTSGVEESVAESVNVRLEGSAIVVDADGYVNVEVYNIDGKVVYAGCPATIELPTHGVYIVKVGVKTIKIVY